MGKHIQSVIHRPDLINPQPPAKLRGLGDLVAVVAQPVAKAIDTVTGTNVQGCGGCKQRQEDWNRKFPFGRQPPQG